MSEEEKKAIKGLEWSQQQMRLGNLPDYNQGHYADIQVVLNLIEKLQNKIEELEKADLTTVHMNGFYEGEKKWKDKIRERIKINEELIKEPAHWKYTENEIRNFKIENLCLEELLEE